MLKNLSLHIEALIHVSETGVSVAELLDVLNSPEFNTQTKEGEKEEITEEIIRELLTAIEEKHLQSNSILMLKSLNNSYQFLTKEIYHPTVNLLQNYRSKKKLSQAALETLAIIAYRQPITKLEIEHIRGVNCDYTIQRLLEKELIIINGKSDSVGRPLLYGTSGLLMDYFGINSLNELPKSSDLSKSENAIGDPVE